MNMILTVYAVLGFYLFMASYNPKAYKALLSFNIWGATFAHFLIALYAVFTDDGGSYAGPSMFGDLPEKMFGVTHWQVRAALAWPAMAHARCPPHRAATPRHPDPRPRRRNSARRRTSCRGATCPSSPSSLASRSSSIPSASATTASRGSRRSEAWLRRSSRVSKVGGPPRGRGKGKTRRRRGDDGVLDTRSYCRARPREARGCERRRGVFTAGARGAAILLSSRSYLTSE